MKTHFWCLNKAHRSSTFSTIFSCFISLSLCPYLKTSICIWIPEYRICELSLLCKWPILTTHGKVLWEINFRIRSFTVGPQHIWWRMWNHDKTLLHLIKTVSPLFRWSTSPLLSTNPRMLTTTSCGQRQSMFIRTYLTQCIKVSNESTHPLMTTTMYLQRRNENKQ